MKALFLYVLMCTAAMYTYATLTDTEYHVLQSFFDAQGGPYWFNKEGWKVPDTDPCTEWFGVGCTDDGTHVKSLSLSNNNLTGNIFSGLPAFAYLSSIDFGSNKLTGPLPVSFYHISNLYAVSLRDNQLSGEINFEFMPNMQFAHLDFNNFNGTLDKVCSCTSLKVLSLVNNQITGNIPDCFAQMTQLQTLQLGGNNLIGTIPTFSAQSLRALDFSRNALSGAPSLATLMKASGLTELELFNNKLTGPISGLSGHPSMVVFDVHGNSMNGQIPTEYATSLPNLMILGAQSNVISGFLPSAFTNSTIASFDFSNNNLYCPLPPLPAGGKATCQYWSLSSINPPRCTVGEKCYVVVTGQGFSVGEKATCVFGDVVSVVATVVSSTELRAIVVPPSEADVDVSIAVNGVVISGNTLPFEFVGKDEIYALQKKSALRRAANADAVKVRIHGESKCPDFGSIVTIFKGIVDVLGSDVLDLDIGFIMKDLPAYPTGFWSLHGQSEVIGNAMILCVKENYGVKVAVEFAACLAEKIDTVPTNAAACAERLGLNYNNIRSCAFSGTGKYLLTMAMNLANDDKAVWSPTIVINDQLYCLWHSIPCKATKDEDFLRAICDAYQGSPVPEACQSLRRH